MLAAGRRNLLLPVPELVRRVLLASVPFAAIGLLWMILVHGFSVPPVFLPPIEQMPGAIWHMFAEEGITQDILISSNRVVGGFGLAVLLATPLGLLIGYSPRASQYLSPVLGFSRYIPVPVFIPLTILWFQTGNPQKMFVIFLGAFFQLTLLVADAAAAVPREYFEAAAMRGAPRRHLVVRVLLPAALPSIYDAYRVCIGWAWTYLVVAEIVGANTGIGYYIIKAQRYLMIPQIFAAMLLIGLLGMGTDLAFGAARPWLFPWAEENRKART